MDYKAILIVDDVEINRDILAEIFKEQYKIFEASDGEHAIAQITEHRTELSLIFLDLQMPKKNGLEVLKFMRQEKLTELIPVIMITGESTAESDVKAYELGAADIIYKPFAPAVVTRRAYNIIELYEHRISVEKMLEQRTLELQESQRKINQTNEFLIDALSSVVEFRSLESGEHVKRVQAFTGIILEHLREIYPEYGITDQQADLIIKAAALHDIGKIAIPDDILLKPGRLTDEEFETMKTHTTQGCEILEKFKQSENEFYQYCYDICRHHHERFDGRGYPDHLIGEDIPIWAQIVSVVDVYDALVSERVYKKPFSIPEAEDMIVGGQCGIFSDRILACFEEAKSELAAMAVGNQI